MGIALLLFLSFATANLASPLPVQVDPPCLAGTCRIVVVQALDAKVLA